MFYICSTMHGVRTDRYKLIRYHRIWDTDEFYDLQEDPHEQQNLIAAPEHQELIKELTGELYDWLESTGGMQIPLKRTDYPMPITATGGCIEFYRGCFILNGIKELVKNQLLYSALHAVFFCKNKPGAGSTPAPDKRIAATPERFG